MNFLLSLFACAAILSLIPAKKYLTRQGLILLGCVLLVGSGIALVLDYIMPWSESSTSLPLYLPGPSTSILGKGWGFFFIAFCWGIALVGIALFKEKKEESRPDSEDAHANATEEDRIRAELEGRIEDLRDGLGDPSEGGKADATMAGGPFPEQNAAEPPAGRYEVFARQAYEALASAFINQTVQRLKNEIAAALNALAQIYKEATDRAYATMAQAYYGQHQNPIGAFEVQELQQEFRQADQNKMQFVAGLNLKPGENPDWPEKRTSLNQLIVLGIGFTLAEFCVSWFFLQGSIGYKAIHLAATAAVLILVLAFGAGAIFQFMRRNETLIMRASAGVGYFSCLFMLFLGFGLLLGYRNVDAKENAAGNLENAAGNLGAINFGTIMEGYASLASDLTNLLVFIINLAAFVFFYWKVLHFFDRFRGYKKVNDRYQAAQQRWQGLFLDNNDAVHDALKHADTQSQNNFLAADAHVAAINEKRAVLGRIVTTITGLYAAVLHAAYRGDVNAYRQGNRDHRSLTVYPAPAYFNSPAPICEIEAHFRDADTGADFLREREDDFSRISASRDAIAEASAEWDAARPDLNKRMLQEFESQVRCLGAGQNAAVVDIQQEEIQEDR